ncbi:MAG: methyltransferase domain-containing protein [Bacteroidetes bacterium]|nr:methyltransferase domain-containing protein [Bacteroidota bacterium]
MGCGPVKKEETTSEFAKDYWAELRFDIDPVVEPDLIGTITDMIEAESNSVDAVYSSHNIEHLYAHEVPKALMEFKRVLKTDGFCVITCPDLQEVARLVADDRLTETAYMSPAGPITPLDIIYGFRMSISEGNSYMAHRCGFTERVLRGTLNSAGFAYVATMKRPQPYFDLWAVACLDPISPEKLNDLALRHFPS